MVFQLQFLFCYFNRLILPLFVQYIKFADLFISGFNQKLNVYITEIMGQPRNLFIELVVAFKLLCHVAIHLRNSLWQYINTY